MIVPVSAAPPVRHRPTVIFADDHSLVAAGISKLLEEEVDLLGTVGDGRAAVALVETHHPDIVLLDISMPLLNGLEAARQIRVIAPASKIIFLTMHSDRAYVVEAFAAGASGYLLKESAVSELPVAIRTVLNDQLYVTPLIGDFAAEDFTPESAPDAELSGRQREVLQLLAEGHSSKQVAAALQVTTKTIEFHKGRIKQKLGLRSTADLVRYAFRNRIIGPDA